MSCLYVLSLAGWNAAFSLDEEGYVLTFCPLGPPYTAGRSRPEAFLAVFTVKPQ